MIQALSLQIIRKYSQGATLRNESNWCSDLPTGVKSTKDESKDLGLQAMIYRQCILKWDKEQLTHGNYVCISVIHDFIVFLGPSQANVDPGC